MPRRIVLTLIAASLAGALAGCGNANGLYPVYGTVTYKGEPAAGATVAFHRQGADASGGEIPRAEVQADGSFRVDCGDLGRGAPPGSYAVLVEWRQGPLRTRRGDAARSVGKAAAREGKPVLLADDTLRGRYARRRPPPPQRRDQGRDQYPPAFRTHGLSRGTRGQPRPDRWNLKIGSGPSSWSIG